MDRQGSVLSTLSDYDILDVIQDDLDDSKDAAHGGGEAGAGCNFLKKNRSIFVKVTVRESHGLTADVLSSTRLYDIECSHSDYHWRIVRKYKQFEELHRALRFYRASLILSRSSAKKVSLPANDGTASAPIIKRKMGRIRTTSLRFPNKPEMFVSSPGQVERRRWQLEEYLSAVLKDPSYCTHEATMRFLEISRLSFIKHGGEKHHERFIQKRSGGRHFSTLFSCFAPATTNWNKRWLVLKDSYICYLRSNQQIADVMLFDQDFDEVKYGLKLTKIRHGLVITNTSRELSLKTSSYHSTRNWATAIERVAQACEYVNPTPYKSFAPVRKELAHWYVDASSYFADVASALDNARREIFITDWWLTPELFLRKPVVHMTDPSRLDKILHKKAKQGVKIYILLYKEIEMAVGGIQSFKCKSHLESLHPNIMVMRHPDHIQSSVYMWTHHEKIVCVDQTIAFLGGIDLCFGRWDDAQHRLTDLGSVQNVTPPPTRPVSVATDDWKGFGLEDLNKQRKKEISVLKGSKKKLFSTSGSISKSQIVFLLGEDVLPAERCRARHYSANDFGNLKGSNPEKLYKPRSYSVDRTDVRDVKFDALIPTLKLNNGSGEISHGVERAYSSGDLKCVAQRKIGFISSSATQPDVFSGDQDVFSNFDTESKEWLDNNKPTVTRAPSKLSKGESTNEIVGEPVLAMEETTIESLSPNGHIVNGDVGQGHEKTNQQIGQGQYETNQQLDQGHDETNQQLGQGHDQTNQQLGQGHDETNQQSVQLTETGSHELNTIYDVVNEVLRQKVPHLDIHYTELAKGSDDTNVADTEDYAVNPLTAGLLSINSYGADSEFNSITSATSVKLPFSSPRTEGTDGPTSTGFGDVSSEERLHILPDVTSSKESISPSGVTEVRKAGRFLLEPIRGFTYQGQAAPRKRSQGKTPIPPPMNAIIAQWGDASGEPVGAKVEKDPSAEPLLSPPASPGKTKSKSWKKIHSNMDKLKRVWRHEESMRNSTAHNSGSGSRKSSASSLPIDTTEDASKYWIGKDYVNWIHKDLDCVKFPFHDSVDRFSTVRMPWHDIGVVVFNKAATDVGRHFIQRWNHAKKVKASSRSSSKYPLLIPRSTLTSYKRLPPFIKDMCELVNCQILRSCSGWSSGMQKPENSIYNAYMDLIENSQHYIYIENQFFISWCGTEVENCICEALVNRILKAHEAQQTFRVYLVLPLLPAFEADLDPQKSGGSALFSVLYRIQQSLVGHENSLFKKLYSHGLAPSRYVSVCGLRKHGVLNHLPVTELIYVHSKLMIVDDRKCIIGSANINDRSLSGERDSEIATVIEDEFFIDSKMTGADFQAGKFCYSLRNCLFQEHLGLRDDEYIQDVTCEEFYKNTWVTTSAINTSIFHKVFNCLPCDSVTTFPELRECRAKTPLSVSDPVAAKKQLTKVKGHLVMYPLNFLKDEVLLNHMGTKENLVPIRFWT